MKIKDFRNKSVYVVGGSAGIGLETAKLLTGLGSNVVIFARRKEPLEEALKQMEHQRVADSQKLKTRTLDITDNKQVHRVMDTVVREFGVPDILINCAGRAIPGYFEDISYEQFDATMKVNLYGIRNTVAALVPHMKARGGYIVNASSMVGFLGVFGYTDYAASKFAVSGFTETLRSELKRFNIGVSNLCPPDTNTPGYVVENETKPPETRAISEKAGLMEPEQTAKALLHGIRNGKAVIIPGLDGKFTYLMKRLFPGLVEWIMDRTVRKTQREK